MRERVLTWKKMRSEERDSKEGVEGRESEGRGLGSRGRGLESARGDFDEDERSRLLLEASVSVGMDFEDFLSVLREDEDDSRGDRLEDFVEEEEEDEEGVDVEEEKEGEDGKEGLTRAKGGT